MEVIGLAGGVASGKSTVARMFADLGAVVLDADRIGHEVLSEPEVKQRLRAEFGSDIFSAVGEVERAAVARLVFGPDEASRSRLLTLEDITHPRISARLWRELQRLKELGAAAAVLDAAVMFKAGWDRFCSRIVFVTVPQEVRLERAKNRGWALGELQARENRQAPLTEKEAKATDLLDNSGTAEHLNRQVRQLWQSWGLPLPEEGNRGN